jgi:hypothetical protein
LCGHFLVPVATEIAGESAPAVLVAVFVVAFPTLVYAFLSAFWTLKIAQRALP